MTSPSYPCRCRLLMLNKIILDDTDTRTHTRTHTPVGLPWTRDRSVVYISLSVQHLTFTQDRHPCPRRGLKPKSQQASCHLELERLLNMAAGIGETGRKCFCANLRNFRHRMAQYSCFSVLLV
jgi:hypothetical protein